MTTAQTKEFLDKLQKHSDDLGNANTREQAIQWMADAAELLEESIEVIKELEDR